MKVVDLCEEDVLPAGDSSTPMFMYFVRREESRYEVTVSTNSSPTSELTVLATKDYEPDSVYHS